IIGVVVLGVAIICGGIIYMVTSMMRSGVEMARGMEETVKDAVKEAEEKRKSQQAAQTFAEDSVAGRLNAAYDSTTANFKAQWPQRKYDAFFNKHFDPRDPPPAVILTPHGVHRYRYTVRTATNLHVELTLTVSKEGNVWKVDQMTVDPGDLLKDL